MKHTVKSILYDISRSKPILGLFAGLSVILVILSALSMGEDQTSGLYLSSGAETFLFPVFIVGAVVGIVCCSDMKDKVANYEILSGHSRKEFYFARFLISVLLAAVLALLLSFVPMLFGTLVYGWGEKLVFSQVLLRQALFFFPFLRLAAFFVCLSFLAKNDLVMIAASFGISIAAPMMLNFFPDAAQSVSTGIYNCNCLMDFHVWEIYNVTSKGLVKYRTGSSALDPSLIGKTIAISLVMTVVYMMLGYGLFKSSDID